uniref:Uncharacterized protein n=1 Tax=Lactuca sativa TaxID=4236 RepID=A0A9R1VX75_LACSA|nr:hypothetical protein LSAT_V11C400186290 [Lactuca sativa]
MIVTWMTGTCTNCGIIIIWIYETFPYARGVYVLRRNKDTHRIKRWSAIKKLKWVDVNKIFYVTKEGHRPRYKMIPSENETRKSYYLPCLEYVFGEPALVQSPVWKHFRSGRFGARARQSSKPSIEDLANQVITLEKMEFLNRQRTKVNQQHTEVNVEELSEDDLWGHINFDEPVHTTPKLVRRGKKKLLPSSIPHPPPPVFSVDLDFTIMCLQPYIPSNEAYVIISNYVCNLFGFSNEAYVIGNNYVSKIFDWHGLDST